MKKGDKVMMVNCGEADFHKDKVWVCRTDSFVEKHGDKKDVIFLEGYGGYFLCECLVMACTEKNCNKPATTDYNGHRHMLCESHYESLTEHFEEEYD